MERGAGNLEAVGLGDSQREILLELKRRGEASLGEIASRFDLATETLREHLNSLTARGLVDRVGRRRDGPGRPASLYGLSERGERLFPQREGELLRELTEHLAADGREGVLETFFERRIARQRQEAEARLDGLEGEERFREVARILTEQGFMAEVESAEGGETRLRLCRCRLKEMVAVSRLPCRAEIGFIEELLGESLDRSEYMPEGDHACTYQLVESGGDG
jgi:predicted ArsR family transcriptional regulator